VEERASANEITHIVREDREIVIVTSDGEIRIRVPEGTTIRR
jgi:hypothetical protein